MPVASLQQRSFKPKLPAAAYHKQWSHPRDVFSILLLLGGDVVNRALAQLAGSGLTPVAFSFGWVSYAVTALTASAGENKLMPDPDCDAIVINASNGYVRTNTSWVIGRLVRDFGFWSRKHPEIEFTVQRIIDERHDRLKEKVQPWEPSPERPKQAGLCVSIYEAGDASKMAIAEKDWVYKSGFVVMICQLGIASIPCGLFGDWGILMLTAAGIVLTILTGALSQWKMEKWACRRKCKKTVILTRGNGSQHAIVVIGKGRGLDLEDLAAVSANVDVLATLTTRMTLLVLAIAWVLLLITAAGTKRNTWFLLAVGAIGILHNAAVAGWRRRPENFGVPLEFVEVIGTASVMDALFLVEQHYPYVGLSMREVFFPGRLRPLEQQEWTILGLEAKAADAVATAEKEERKGQAAGKARAAAEDAKLEAERARNAFGPRRTGKGAKN